MALVSGRGSTLNPNAPPFIPAVYRQVEDFSSEWWNLVQNSAWFRDYWLSEHQDASFEDFNESKDDDITNLLPDTFDVGYDEDFAYLESEFGDMVGSFGAYESSGSRTEMKPQHGAGVDLGALMKNLNLHSPSSKGRDMNSMMEHAKYNERPVQRISPNHGPRRIHQPR